MRTWADNFFLVFLIFFFFLCAVLCLRLLPNASWKRKTVQKNFFALRASCQRLLLSAIWKRKTEKMFFCASRIVPALSAKFESKQKSCKKKISCIALRARAFCQMWNEKKGQKFLVRQRRGCFFRAWRIVLLVLWLRLGETEWNSSLCCYCFFVNVQMKKMRTWTDK